MSLSDLAAWAEIVQGITNLLLVFIAVSAGLVAMRQLRIAATTDLFNRLSLPEAREQRRWVYHHCEELSDAGKASEWEKKPEVLDRLESVCTSFDWVGLSVQKGFLKEKDVIDLYGDSIIRLWVALRPWITHYRTTTGSSDWLWENFKRLADEAIKEDQFKSWLSDGVPFFTPTKIVRLRFDTSSITSIRQISDG